MSSWPITYVGIILWLIFISYGNKEYWTRWIMKVCGSIGGYYIAVNTVLGGSQFLVINDITNTSNIDGIKTSLDYPIGIIMVGVSTVVLYVCIMSYINGDWKNPLATEGS